MSEPQRNDAKAQADHALAILDALADKWVEEIRLVDSIKHISHVTRNLRADTPADVREHFIGRQEAQIYAVARQAFIEGAYRAITGLQDEKAEMKRLGINPDRCS